MVNENLRNFGIECVGRIPWNTHGCNIFNTEEELLKTLLPYFKLGLENNEYCLYISGLDMQNSEIIKTLNCEIKNLYYYIEKKQFEIISYKDWYLNNKGFDKKTVIDCWSSKLEKIQIAGFDGLRTAANLNWLTKEIWPDWLEYKHEINEILKSKKIGNILAVCCYNISLLDQNNLSALIFSHSFTILHKDGRQRLIANSN